ncbi:laccase-5-like isoform X2 [Osmia bicornis bicornis]|uniref:laccase-5-like isoform X2 n=1 Tax=Osmia bicornis bicornis TaxID=1437191 RepID=UPI0010F92C0B|nr:laccase-5-like isoform X2 [Osmia bicornis bicornis]XP_029056022.1 laccase-5-like isoform X2 [Osmia bicornis bicornis]XP_029056024.1 laccase-5-like isoform X2 [Osmia bicornis bicornis]XP_029056025.1 laccase-5-like isoform X2 [Osmia bicornis bicornis]XP_029056026.1 laccase-5-like isoform X2 [Osmia bicornis bicornis]XP_029056027.1 laccase-5-like isoform X2 [Osmia bicornis bicornis]XP_029056028.1 laccase-5-like isoform X2 [Osmia bicornis bicornis]XP_046146125.1 laccase-5-like isoform X2 [Osmi
MRSLKSTHCTMTLSTYCLRFLVVVFMIAAAATFLHVNNYRPKQTFLSCDRPCHHLDWPMICRLKLTLEVFQSLSKSCGDCPVNETACLHNHCVTADGQRRGILTANRQLPGPTIQVCENDILVVDVINRLPGKAAAMHWRGQSQFESPFMDGAPLVTQCPIPSYTTFQYKFRASVAGTHLWHAHAGADVTNGIFGALIVKQADIKDPHRSLYDIDDSNHVVLVSQWQHSADITFTEGHAKPAILLINGKGRQPNGPNVPYATFTVVPGRRHRFRIANAGGAGSCPITISVDAHPLQLIALDGQPVEPRQVASITLAKGERADFILKANKRVASYWMNVHTSKECGTSPIHGAAILKYKGSTTENPLSVTEAIDQPEVDETTSRVAMTTNPAEKCENPENLCVTEIQALRKIPSVLAKPRTDVIIRLPINYKFQTNDIVGNGGAETRILNVNNDTFTYPSSPLLTQGADVSEESLCSPDDEDSRNENNETASLSSRRCRRGDGIVLDTCECVHVRYIPFGATVEIILFDQGGLDDLVYHLHGYSFYVVGARKFGRSVSLHELKSLDEKGQLFNRNLDCTVAKDTVVVPKFGAVAIRFKANNPGYWMLRDEHAAYWTRGLDVILQVGENSDMVPAPQDFPKCGSFVGPDYFLI